MPIPPRPMPRPPMPGAPGPVGGASGPGGTPMVAPGQGAGNAAAARAMVANVFKGLRGLMNAFPDGSKDQQAVMKAMAALNPLFGTNEGQELEAAGARQMNAMGAPGNPLAGTPSPGIMQAPMPPNAGAPPGQGQG